MSYILEAKDNEDVDGFILRYKNYYDYIESIKDKIPASVYQFAVASWHYNHEDPRCLHDAWLEEISIHESSSGERQQIRSTEITIRLLGAFHNGYIELTYEKIHSYSVSQQHYASLNGHGDWLIDEVRLSSNGFVLHEIIFEQGKWLIECENIIYQWKPFIVTQTV